ncbi:MAG: capsular biosynthesis protein [Sphingomonas sp.]|jgi:capsular polysaccharide export protein
MKPLSLPQRVFLFLQGPPGPFFPRLGEQLAARGMGIFRINLNGGDRRDWPEGSVDYRGRTADWPMYFDRFVRQHKVTDLVLYGDCRPMHLAAHRLARLRGIRIHVFEEGYIRPNWMTLERDGVNGHSRLDRNPDSIREAARDLPPVPDLPQITASFRRRAHDSYWHYHYIVTGVFRFPYYRNHRPGVIIGEGFGWINKFARRKQRARLTDDALNRIAGRDYYLFPLQLTGDYQIRAHSPFPSMEIAAEYVLDSFAHFAPPGSLLLVKEHPLDCTFRSWRAFLAKRARKLGIADRVVHIDGGDLTILAREAIGMVCVNSTSGTLALETGIPVIVLGDAIYDVPGVTHQGALDRFWQAPEAPDMTLYDAFKRVLHARCLVRGGLASESAIRTLLDNTIDRLINDDPIAISANLAEVISQAVGSNPSSLK